MSIESDILHQTFCGSAERWLSRSEFLRSLEPKERPAQTTSVSLPKACPKYIVVSKETKEAFNRIQRQAEQMARIQSPAGLVYLFPVLRTT